MRPGQRWNTSKGESRQREETVFHYGSYWGGGGSLQERTSALIADLHLENFLREMFTFPKRGSVMLPRQHIIL